MSSNRFAHEAPLHTHTLEIDTLPKGRRARLFVELAQDAMARPVAVPVVVARGRHDGPVLGITAALHGNELNGIPVVHQLIDGIDLRSLHGTLVGVVVTNVPGYLRNQRCFPDDTDLNHIMPGRPDGNDAEVYAHRLMERVIQHFDYLVDLHTASFGRINSLYVRADLMHAMTARMAYLHRPQIILHNPPSDGTLRGQAMALGIPAVTVEIGDPHVFQPRHIRPTLAGIRRVLVEIGMTPQRSVKTGTAPIICESSKWIYTDSGGLLRVLPDVAECVQEGAVIARQRNLFGQPVREYRAPHAGVVIGKSVDPVGRTGARILHLGRIAPDDAFPVREEVEG